MSPHTSEQDLLASLQFVSRSIEDVTLASNDEDEEPSQLIQELVPLLQPLVDFMKKRELNPSEDSPDASTLAASEPTMALEHVETSDQDCREQAAEVLNEIQIMVASEIQTWKEHCARCSTLERAGVPRAEECRQMEKQILQEYEKLQKRVESCFHGIRVKTDGKLLSPHELQMAEWLDHIQGLETRLKEKEDRERALDGEVLSLRETLGQFEGIFLEEIGAFGARAWNKYLGDVGEDPPLPPNIIETMESPCPLWTGKRRRETHLLVLIPSTVNGQPFSLDLLETLKRNPKTGERTTSYWHYDSNLKNQIGSKSVEKSYWILFTREVFPGSPNKTYDAQKALMADRTQLRINLNYKHPSTLEAATVVLTNYVRTGDRLLGNVWTRCEDRIDDIHRPCVGYFDTPGIKISVIQDTEHSSCGSLACCAWKQH